LPFRACSKRDADREGASFAISAAIAQKYVGRWAKWRLNFNSELKRPCYSIGSELPNEQQLLLCHNYLKIRRTSRGGHKQRATET